MLTRSWDERAQSILQHWHSHQLPLVVCRQREHTTLATISVGLPAPTVWGRRKLALELYPHDVARVGVFPALGPLTRQHFPGSDLEAFLSHLQDLNVPVQVYGSFGWQWLTGMVYVHPMSDLDIRAEVTDNATARAVARALDALTLPVRVDGELAFADGSAIAWREYLQWTDGRVDRVLVKSRTSVQLLDPAKIPDRGMPCIA